MCAAQTYGGWVTEQTSSTGGTSSFVRLVGWVAVIGTALTVGTGGALSLEHLQRSIRHAEHAASNMEISEDPLIRTPSENLVRIREVLNPAISDLATTFGVSRQSVYNWLNGEPVAEENAAKLQDLAQAADVLAYEGIATNAMLLKRKFVNGKTLLQVMQTGGSSLEAALLLVQIHKREVAQRERMNIRSANRARTPATADFDLPAFNDHV